MTRIAALLPLLLVLAGPAAAQQGAGETCLGVGGLQCAEGLMCVVPDGEADVDDASGTCTPVEDSMCTMEYAPVCGSDGKTYGNACQAEAAGADVSSTGACGG